MTWSALTSWALDTEVLAPLNFTRCFFRTEIHPDTGDPHVLDWIAPLQVLSDGRPLDVLKENALGYSAVADRVKTLQCNSKARNELNQSCKLHQYFVSPMKPFQGMWVATRHQLQRFMEHPLWNKTEALKADIPLYFGYPERSSSVNILVDVPAGYRSSCMVPYDGPSAQPLLSLEASIDHMRNGYSSSPDTKHGKLTIKHALIMG